MEMEVSRQAKTLRRWGYWGAWTCVGLYISTMDMPHITWWKAVLGDLVQYETWGLLSLGTLRLARRFPLGGWRTWRSWLLHFGTSIAFTFIALFITRMAFAYLVEGRLPAWFSPEMGAGFRRILSNYFHYSLLTYWIVVGIHHAFQVYERAKARELQASQLETQLSKAQLQALRMQLQPHFLFNTLHAVTALMRRDVNAAEKMLARLSELLRLSLDQNGHQEVSLRQELAILEKYLEIERIRFQGRLHIDLEIPPELLTAQVPAFLLQPLVENALKHALAPQIEGGRLLVRAERRDHELFLEVQDDGAGLPRQGHRPGVGTSNTRSRLERLYGTHQSFELIPLEKGTIARVRLPFHEEVTSP